MGESSIHWAERKAKGELVSTLDEQVAEALGWIRYPEDSIEHGTIWHMDADKAPFGRTMDVRDFEPSTNWYQGGKLLEEHGVATMKFEHREGVSCEPYWLGLWNTKYSSSHYNQSEEGRTLLEAGMKALVAKEASYG